MADADVVDGDAGNDCVDGGVGDDALDGEAGHGTLNGGGGSDTLVGGTGDDTYVTDGGDTITENAGGGTDTLQITDRTLQTLSLRRDGTSVIVEQGGSSMKVTLENVFGSVASERIETTDGLRVLKTTLTGSASNEILVGGSADETLQGFGGSDYLAGGGGKDRLEGGTGADIFGYAALSDSGTASTARDTIMDFAQGSDVISLRGIDANTTLANDQAFSFVGTGAFAGAGSLRYSLTGGNTLVEADVNGDGAADFAILLAGSINLAASDFVL